MSVIIAVMQFKGGVGKTTIATNLAAGCARTGLRTVLVESDGQGNASQSMRVKPFDGFYELIVNHAAFDSVIVPVPTEFHGVGELYLLAAFGRQQEVESFTDAPLRIVQRLAELRQMVDVIVIDTSPGNTEVHAGVFYSADYLVLPTLCDFLSIKSLATTLQHRQNAINAAEGTPYRVADILGIVPNRFTGKEDVQQANLAVLHRTYDNRIRLFDLIRDLTAWRQASQMRQSIYAYEPQKPHARRQARIAANELRPVLDAVLSIAPLRTEGAL